VDDDDTYLSARASNDNGLDLSALDYRLLGDMLELLYRATEGIVERELHDALIALNGDATAADVNGALEDARCSGFIVLRQGRLALERRVTREQLMFVREAVRKLGGRGAT
jgi:hypothetical protein